MLTYIKKIINYCLLVPVRVFYRFYFYYKDVKNFISTVFSEEVLSDKIIENSIGDKFCVLLLYQKYDIQSNILNLLRVLKEKNINVLIVSNLKINKDNARLLEPYSYRIIERKNYGRDFGGYRCGILKVLNDNKPKRLIILNDSIFYQTRGLDNFVAEMSENIDKEFIAATENFEFDHHGGSFALSFGKNLINDKRFVSYWRNYRNSEFRPKVIKKGELGLSSLIINKIGIKPYIIYNIKSLQISMKSATFNEINTSVKSMPSSFYTNPNRELYVENLLNNKISKFIFIENSFNSQNEDSNDSFIKNEIMKNEGLDNKSILDLISLDTKNAMIEKITGFGFKGSQIHLLGYVFSQYLRCPIVKNDLVVRLVYRPEELLCFKNMMTDSEYEEFMFIQVSRGNPLIHWKGKKKLLMLLGYI